MNKKELSEIVKRYPGFQYVVRSYYGNCPFLVYRGNLPRIPEFDAALNANENNKPGMLYWYAFTSGGAKFLDYSCGKGSPDYRVKFPWKEGVGWEAWGFEYLPSYSGQFNGMN